QSLLKREDSGSCQVGHTGMKNTDQRNLRRGPWRGLLCIDLHGERHKCDADSEHDAEPDQPHGHLGEDSWRESSRTPRRAPAQRRMSTRYWITWSARCSSDCGILKPRALAVLRLTTNSNLVGCSTGRSAGFAPFRILSTKTPRRAHLSRRIGTQLLLTRS